MKYDLSEKEKQLTRDLIGFFNFATGTEELDPNVMRKWNELYESFEARGSVEIWRDVLDAVDERIRELSAVEPAFQDSERAKRVLTIVRDSLKEYREFHQDTLFKIDDAYLFNAYFLARVSRAALLYESTERPTAKVVEAVSDYLGYRPIPVLEGGEKHEPNLHEWIAPLSLYYEGAGVAVGPYRKVIEKTLEIIGVTDYDILFDASFDMSKLRELAVDPRPYDFDHPVNRRLNYSFGYWDDRSVDNDGYFRRFIIHRTVLDAIVSRIEEAGDDSALQERYVYEAAAVLAGTMLMGSGACGGRFQQFDASTQVSSLADKIAVYRDAFYDRLLRIAPTSFRAQLEQEEKSLHQPFAKSRQFLNRKLALTRADQMQRFNLARVYARMGYFDASRRQAEIIETVASRFLSKIDCELTRAHLLTDQGKLDEAAALLPEIEKLLRRGIDCGAFPDLWSILAFDAEYSLFPPTDYSAHDHRIDGMIDLLNDLFDLYSRLQKEAAATGRDELRFDLLDQMSDLASWWDQFGSCEIDSVEGFSGQEAWESSSRVSTALAAWYRNGAAVGNIKFWSQYVENFHSPKAFASLGSALLDRGDFISCASLLYYWLDLSDHSVKTPLVEDEYSFNSLAYWWLSDFWNPASKTPKSPSRKRVLVSPEKVWTFEEYEERWDRTTRFIAGIEANAGDYWKVPTLELSPEKFRKKIVFNTNNPLLAEFSRRLILATKQKKNADGSVRYLVNASLRDAARVFDADNLPSVKALETFYNENRKSFPGFITFEVFLEIFIGAVNVRSAKLQEYNFRLDSEKTKSRQRADLDKAIRRRLENSSPDEKSQELWNAMLKELGLSDSDPQQETVRKMLDKLGGEPKSESSVYIPNFSSELNDDDSDDESSAEDDDFDDLPDEESTITGGDPTFSAAYEGVSYHDSADDGTDGSTASGGEGRRDARRDLEGEQREFATETDRITGRLGFLTTVAKLWKFAALKSPLVNYNSRMDEKRSSDVREIVGGWLNQAIKVQNEMFELLDKTSRYVVPKSSGTSESLVDYDQLRGAKEILLDATVSAIVDLDDTILILKAILRVENAESYEKKWKTTALQTMSAIFRRDAIRVRSLWPGLIAELKKETLLYIPTARGGDARAIVEARRLQQLVARFLDLVPKLGLYKETFQLVECARVMEQITLSAPGSITEYDRLVETTLRAITDSLAESSEIWNEEPSERHNSLVDLMRTAVEVVLLSWGKHSSKIRISTVESIEVNNAWNQLREFIKVYGADLFTQQFLSFRSLRAILHQGTANFLTTLIEMKRNDEELESGELLVNDIINKKCGFDAAAMLLEVVLECVAENYSEYVDFNSTTALSDNGSNLYIFIDFLRLLIKYERTSWNLKPVYWSHDALTRAGRVESAGRWIQRVTKLTQSVADDLKKRYDNLCEKYGVWMLSIQGRLDERFIRPLEVAQMCGLVFDAISAVREQGEDNSVFHELEAMIDKFAKQPQCKGFEIPDWLNELQEEVWLMDVDSKEDFRFRESKEQIWERIPFAVERIPLEALWTQFNDLDVPDSFEL